MDTVTYTKTEAAELLGVSRQTIHNMQKAGQFPGSPEGPITGYDIKVQRQKEIKALQKRLDLLNDLVERQISMDRLKMELIDLARAKT